MIILEEQKPKKNLLLRWVLGSFALIACWFFVGAGMTIALEGSAVQEVSGLIGFLVGIGALVMIVRS